jgi:hypothetical protein
MCLTFEPHSAVCADHIAVHHAVIELMGPSATKLRTVRLPSPAITPATVQSRCASSMSRSRSLASCCGSRHVAHAGAPTSDCSLLLHIDQLWARSIAPYALLDSSYSVLRCVPSVSCCFNSNAYGGSGEQALRVTPYV